MIARDQLKSIVERIERLHEERKAIADDVSEVYKEAKANGFDTKVLRVIISDRAKDKASLEEFDAIYQLYASALGMLPDFETLDEFGIDHATRAPAQGGDA